MNLAVIPSRGGSLEDLARTGQLGRLTEYYFPAYARRFDRVLYFSYAREDRPMPAGCELRPGPGRMHSLAYSLWLPFRYRADLRTCSVARVMQMTGAIPAILAKARYGVPFAATYGYRYSEVIRRSGRRVSYCLALAVERAGLRAADAVIVTTGELHAFVRRWVGPERIHLIPNGVDTSAFGPAPSPPANRRALAVFVGRLDPQKNLFALLEAAAIVGELDLLFVGDGTQREQLRERARRLGVNLELAGIVPHEDLPALLRRADLFVLPSHIEGHPKALLEAMSVALTCVGTDVEGIRTLLRDGETGILSPGTDAGSLAAALGRALADRPLALELGRRARGLVEAEYDLKRTLEMEITLLADLGERGV
jgi:glycosyltransferase involved in cell wall biosynthesis